jgi:hypothetical protein
LATQQAGLKAIFEASNKDIDISVLPGNGDESWQFIPTPTEPLLESMLATSRNEYKLLFADHAENPWQFDIVKGKDTGGQQVKIPSDNQGDSSKQKYRCIAATEIDTDDL